MGSPEMMMKNFIFTLLMSSIATKHFLVQTKEKAGDDFTTGPWSTAEPNAFGTVTYCHGCPSDKTGNQVIVDLAVEKLQQEKRCSNGDVKVSNFKAQIDDRIDHYTNYMFDLVCPEEIIRGKEICKYEVKVTDPGIPGMVISWDWIPCLD